MSRRNIRCLSTTFAVVAIVLLGAGTALAQEHVTGFDMHKSCPAAVASGASFNCQYTIANNDTFHGVGALAVTNEAPFPAGTPVPVECRQPFSLGDPCDTGAPVTQLGPATDPGTRQCGGCLPETAPINCNETPLLFSDQVHASGTDMGGIDGHQGEPADSTTTNSTNVQPLVCVDNNACSSVACDPNATSVATACVETPDPPCASDNNACTTEACDPVTGCGSTPNPPCASDNNACTTEACDPVTGCGSTPNPPCASDNNACTTEACDPVTGCGSTPNPPCDDNNSCTDDSCDPTLGCVFTDNGTCGEIICRTPGFWGTHGGTEKTSAEPTTCDVLANFGGSLVICGEPITNCTLCSDESALEAICVSPKGDSSLQLARQLTAAALNCAVSKTTDSEGACVPAPVDGANPCSGLGTIEDLFQACNSACPGSLTGGNTIPCIGLIDCFNNGFAIEFDEATNTFSCGELTGCHEKDSGCFDQTPPKAAGSSRECNDSRKDCVTIFGTIDGCTEEICVP